MILGFWAYYSSSVSNKRSGTLIRHTIMENSVSALSVENTFSAFSVENSFSALSVENECAVRLFRPVRLLGTRESSMLIVSDLVVIDLIVCKVSDLTLHKL